MNTSLSALSRGIIAIFLGFLMTNIHYESKSIGFATTIVYLIFFMYLLYLKNTNVLKTWIYSIPILLIILSFSIYEAPYTNIISFIILPFIMGFYHIMHHVDDVSIWNKTANVFEMMLKTVLKMIPTSVVIDDISTLISSDNKEMKAKIGNIIKGIVLFIIASCVIIPLLSFANMHFEEFINIVFEHIYDYISLESIIKFVISIIVSIILYTVFIKWNAKISYVELPKEHYNTTTISTFIICLIALYVLFTVFQLIDFKTYFIIQDFSTVEMIAKTGFWSLFIVSMINMFLINTIEYSKKENSMDILMKVFIVISSVIMLSGAIKILFYIFLYGLSYEKFYVLMTVIYSIILYIYLLYYIFIRPKNSTPMLYKPFIIALWTYASIAILPIDIIIYKANMLLKTHPNTRINIEELSALSYDVIPFTTPNDDIWVKDIDKNYDEEVLYNTNIMALINKNKD